MKNHKTYNPIKNFHLVMNKKTATKLRNIARNQKISVSKLVRKILETMQGYIQNIEFSASTFISRQKYRLNKKTELRVYILKKDYDFLCELAYILQAPSVARLFRHIIEEYLRNLGFDGHKEYSEKMNRLKQKYLRKKQILSKNNSYIHKTPITNSLLTRVMISITENNSRYDLLLL